MALKNISSKSVKIYNPYGLYVTPFLDANEKGTDVYFLGEVIRDSTTITQDDPTENRIENEFSSAPIYNSTQLGSYNFSADVADMQPDLLEILCGYVEDGNRAFAPAQYTPVYAEIALVFKLGEGQFAAAILPKVQLNSKATFDSLSTSLGRITLAGTGLNISVDGHETPFYIDSRYVREGEIGLKESDVKSTSFTVTAIPKNVTVEANSYEWDVNGKVESDEKDNTLSYTKATADTNYTIRCRAKVGENYTDYAVVKVHTPA